MNVYTVSFFGHRMIENISTIEKRLTEIIKNLIENKVYIKFLFGNDGEFDWLVSSVISRVTYGHYNSYTVLVLPYMKAGYRDHKENYLMFYNEVEICDESSKAYFKKAFEIRNRNMVDRSDLVICCIQHKNGGAYKTIQYAKNHCPVINIGGFTYEWS